MALNSVQIPVALPGKTKLDLSCDHPTTMNFGELQPVHYRHCFKGERLRLHATATVRPYPLACPTFGRMRLNIRHFYVPFRVVFPQFDSFYNDTIGVNYDSSGIIEHGPVFHNDELFGVIYGMDPVNVSADNPDFDPAVDVYDFFDGNSYYVFGPESNYYYKLLTSLGYEINFNIQDKRPLSALAFLSLAKIYVDWYSNQAYQDSVDVIAVKKLCSFNDPTNNLVLNAGDIIMIFDLIKRVTYMQDYYFIGSWDNPFAPNNQQYSALSFTDIVNTDSQGNPRAAVTLDSDGTPVMHQNSDSSIGQFNLGSQYLHDALKAITNYSKRHQLAGATNISRTLAEFGFGVKHLQSDRSIYIGGSSVDVNTGAVYSTANTATGDNPSTLGDYAGNGYGQGASVFEFTPDEFGIQISIATILPSGGMFQGLDPNNQHLTKDSFYHPDFDGLGVQLLRKSEVYISKNGDFGGSDGTGYDFGFAWTGRYAEYKRPRNWVTGDLRLMSRFRGGSAWHLMREFTDDSWFGSVSRVHHSLSFTRYGDNDQYRRIFTYDKDTHDLFIVFFHFDVAAFAPCHPLFETYDFDLDGSKSVTLESQSGIVN